MLSIRRGPRCRCPVLAPPRAYLGSPAAPCRCRPAPCNPLNTSAGCVPPSTPQTLHVFSHHLPLLTFPSPTRPARLLTAGQTLGPDTGSHHVDRPCRVLQRSIHTTRANLLLPPACPDRLPTRVQDVARRAAATLDSPCRRCCNRRRRRRGGVRCGHPSATEYLIEQPHPLPRRTGHGTRVSACLLA